MAVTEQDVRHVADLARLGLDEARIPRLAAELNGILAHMEVLNGVDTERVSCTTGVSSGGMPLRADVGPAYPLSSARETFAPAMRDGLLLVPRLATHAAAGGGDDLAVMEGLDEAPDSGEELREEIE